MQFFSFQGIAVELILTFDYIYFQKGVCCNKKILSFPLKYKNPFYYVKY